MLRKTTDFASLFNLQTRLLVAYSAPLILVCWFVGRYGVNVPFGDQWEMVDNLFNHVADGEFRFANFFAQNNEHRLVFPRFIFVALAFVSKWDIRWELCFSIFLGVLIFLSIFKLASLTQGEDKVLFHLFGISTCILVFSLVQVENWLWGFQIAWFLINLCVCIAVLLLSLPDPRLPFYLRLFLAALSCFIASFSSVHGMVSWLTFAPLILVQQVKARTKWIGLGIWLSLFVISCFVYSIGYYKLNHHPSIFFFLKSPLSSLEFLLVLIGRFASGIFSPLVAGIFVVLGFGFFNFYFVKNYSQEKTRLFLPWLLLGWFSFLFALATTLGRAGFGVAHAMSSRYSTVTILLVISCLQMLRLLVTFRTDSAPFRVVVYTAASSYQLPLKRFSSGLLAVLLFFSSTAFIHRGWETWLERQAGKTCFEVVHYLEPAMDALPENCLTTLYPVASRVRSLADYLEKMGFRTFPKNLAFRNEPLPDVGYIDLPSKDASTLVVRRGDGLKMKGWAALREPREIPRVVFFSYGDKQSFFTTAMVKLERTDVAKAFNSDHYRTVGWESEIILPKDTPLGETVVKVWVYSPIDKFFVRLNGEAKIKVVED